MSVLIINTMTRRFFLILMPVLLITPSGVMKSLYVLLSFTYKRFGKFPVIYKTILPHSMNLFEYESLKKRYQNSVALADLTTTFKEKGLIFSEEQVFTGEMSIWLVQFSGFDSFIQFQYLSRQSLIDFKKKRNLGLHTEIVAGIELPPFQVLPSKTNGLEG